VEAARYQVFPRGNFRLPRAGKLDLRKVMEIGSQLTSIAEKWTGLSCILQMDAGVAVSRRKMV
jgi:hypothetical protein